MVYLILSIINTELKAIEDLFVLIQKIVGKCSSLEHVFFARRVQDICLCYFRNKTEKRGPLKGVTYIPCLNFKTCHFMYKRGCYLTVGILLMYFSVVVTVLTHLCVVCCHCCCPTSLFHGHACRNFYTNRASQ